MATPKLNSGFNLEVKKNKAVAAPTKQTINFVHPKRRVNPIKLILILIVVLAALAAFAKFGILDQQAKLKEAEDYRDLQQAQLDAINAQLAGYDELADQYGRYSYGWMDEAETGLVSRTDLLDIINHYILPKATVLDYSVSNNVVTLNLSGITLQQGSSLVNALETDPQVSSAMINSAVAEEAAEATIRMSIVLAKEVDEE